MASSVNGNKDKKGSPASEKDNEIKSKKDKSDKSILDESEKENETNISSKMSVRDYIKKKQSLNKSIASLNGAEREKPEENEKDKVVANDIEAADIYAKIEESNEEVIYNQRTHQSDEVFSIWWIDLYLHARYKHINVVYRYIIEIVTISVLFLFIPIIGAVLTKNYITLDLFTGPIPKDESSWLFLVRMNIFAAVWYAADGMFGIFSDYSSDILTKILYLIDLDKSEFFWGVVQIVNVTSEYLRISATFFFGFFFSNIMFNAYESPRLEFAIKENIVKALMLWIAIYSGMLFLVKFIINVFTSDIKRSNYREAIWDLNYQTFIFKKLKTISEVINEPEDVDFVSENMVTGYDPGFYLRERNIFLSADDAATFAENIMALLDPHTLSYEQIQRFFPGNHENVYKYLMGSADALNKTHKLVKPKQLKNLARELYSKRKDMLRTLRDRDSVFNKLDLVFAIFTTYAALVILLLLFKADYKLFVASFGTSFVTFSWVFADSIKNIYLCFLFLLVVRPYDIGDKVSIEGEILLVYKVDLLTSTFLTETQKLTYIPNCKLVTTKIYNIARSPPQKQTIELKVNPETTFEKVLQLEKSVIDDLKKESKFFTGCTLKQVEAGKIIFEISHTKNFQNDKNNRLQRDLCTNIFIKAMSKNGISHDNSFIYNF
jgi:small-conductance mechanosensitive channel